MKRRVFDVPTEVRGSARRVLGSPQPTGVRTRRPGAKGGAKRFKVYEMQPSPSPMLHLTEARPDAFIEGAPRLATTLGLTFHNPVDIKTRQHHEKAPCFQYSQEVIQHVNVLRAQGGDAAVREYLKTLKENQTMSHSSDMVEAELRRNEAPAIPEVVSGTMQAALDDAENKMKFYDSEVKRCTAEADRWRQVAAGLKQVMALTNQPLATVRRTNGNGSNGNGASNGNGQTSSHGQWLAEIRKILTAPMTSRELTDALQAATGKTRPNVQMAISARKRDGQLIVIDEKFCLPEWTDPAKVS